MSKIAYFVHDLNDAAVARRIAMFQAGGASVALAGFYRGTAPATVGGAAAVSLGETADARMADRAMAVLRNVGRPATARAVARGADVIVARNLETLAIAVRVAEPGQRVVYECLDIHRLLLAGGMAGRAIRAVERRLLRRVAMILTSSPAFAANYFVGRRHYPLPIRIEENRVLALEEGAEPEQVPARRPGLPLRIGWFGMLRCRRSLAMLRALVRERRGEVEVLIAGVPAYTEFEDFDRDVADTPGLSFVGRYTAADLPRLYGSVDIAWAIDYFEEGLNSQWLLPNRLYESLAYGAIPMALSGVETGRWLTRHRVGIVVDDPPALPRLDGDAVDSLRAGVAALPRSLLVADAADCRALTHAVTDAPMTDRGAGVLIVIPCLDEEAHLPGLLATLVRESPEATIVVADGGSRDRSRAIAARFTDEGARVHLIDNPARIQSAGINRAVTLHGTGHDWLVRIDAHCGYPPAYVAGLLAAAARTGADAVVVPMRTIGRGCFQKAAAAAQNSRLGTGGSAHRHVGEGRFVDHGHHALFRLDRFRAAGGYDELFACNEDAELDHRQALVGSRIWLEPTLALDYFPRSTPGALFRQYYRYGIGRAMTVAKHRMALKARQAAPLAVAPALLLLLLSPAWWPLALPALAWATLCLIGGAAIGMRTRDRCAAMAGVAAMLMHAGWSLGFLRQWSRRVPAQAERDESVRAQG